LKDRVVHKFSRHVFFAVAVLAAGAAQAQWTGKAEVGLLYSDGNSEAKSANGKLDMTHEGQTWKQNFYAAVLYGENASFATAERYEAHYQADRKINDKLSWFVGLRGEQDKFSGFAYRSRCRPAPRTSSSTLRTPSSTPRSVPVIANCSRRCSSRRTRAKCWTASRARRTASRW
jgi:hypothetical protein